MPYKRLVALVVLVINILIATWVGWVAFMYGRTTERRDCVRPASHRVLTYFDWEQMQTRSCPMIGECK